MPKKNAAVRTPAADPDAIPATPAEMQAVRDGEAKPDNNRPAARAGASAPLVAVPEGELVSASDPAKAQVVDIIVDKAKRPKGYREVEVVATRLGYYRHKRQRAGSVFTMALVGPGFLPSWVKKAKGEDEEPEVARSRQVTRGSTGDEIIADVTRDAGTEVPTYLGGNQREATAGR